MCTFACIAVEFSLPDTYLHIPVAPNRVRRECQLRTAINAPGVCTAAIRIDVTLHVRRWIVMDRLGVTFVRVYVPASRVESFQYVDAALRNRLIRGLGI